MDYLLASHHLENTPFPKEEIVPAFQYYQENYNIAPKYNLATCNIPKILATIKNALFWLLYDTNSYLQGNYSLNTVDWDTLFNHLDSARYQLQDLRKELQPGYSIFTVHREPMARFISGYVDKCINNNFCYHCKKNVTCFVEELYRRLMLFGNGFQLDMDYGMEDFHFNPQTWFCRFNDTFYDYRMIKYESGEGTKQMVDEILDVLGRSCVEENLLKLIEKELMKGETFHTTRGSLVRTNLEEEIYSNPVLINLLIKIYYYDYIVFNYPLPIVSKQ